MKRLTGLERIIKALRIEEPDIVPVIELPSANVLEALLPGATIFDAIEHFDLGGVFIAERGYGGYYGETIDSKHCKNQWGTIVRMVPGTNAYPEVGAIKSEKDLDTWKLPDPDEPARYKWMEDIVKRYKGQRAIIATVTDPFDVANEVRGAADHYMDFVRNPALIDRLSYLIRNYYLKYMRNCVAIGADAIIINGDYATSKWPMLSKEHFVKHVIPVLKALVDEAHRLGVPCIKHTDGNIMPIIDLIVDTGIDGLHPIDLNAGMDLGEVKKKYGKRICLMGNVDCAQILTWGTIEDVREDVKRCIRQAASGGGYICMSSHSIHPAVKPENYKAMIDAARQYGKYPISI